MEPPKVLKCHPLYHDWLLILFRNLFSGSTSVSVRTPGKLLNTIPIGLQVWPRLDQIGVCQILVNPIIYSSHQDSCMILYSVSQFIILLMFIAWSCPSLPCYVYHVLLISVIPISYNQSFQSTDHILYFALYYVIIKVLIVSIRIVHSTISYYINNNILASPHHIRAMSEFNFLLLVPRFKTIRVSGRPIPTINLTGGFEPHT